MQNKKVNHQPSTKYLYIHKITGRTLFSREKNKKNNKKNKKKKTEK